MSIAEPETVATPETDPKSKTKTSRRPLRKRAMHVVRRGHLYLGLFLLPWVALYGVTAFLFNHPSAFSDQQQVQSVPFKGDSLTDTPMGSPPKPAEVAASVVKGLQERAAAGVNYTLVEPEEATYNREFAFATVKPEEGDSISVLVEVNGNGGTIRGVPKAPERKPPERAPFAIGGGGGAPGGQRGGGRGGVSKEGFRKGPVGGGKADALAVESPLHERVKAAIPVVLEKHGYPTGEVTITSVPDLNFVMSDQDGKRWLVTYNAQNGSVGGKPADGDSGTTLSTRRFLTRLHVAHGYPSSPNARWFWAVIVDGMAFVMVFWAVSGLFMWWQLKATRWVGLAIILLSIGVATALGVGMHTALTS
jgi:hypothetical protein